MGIQALSKSGKSSSGKDHDSIPIPDEPLPHLRQDVNQLVTVHVKGITWSVLDFTVRLKGCIRVHELVSVIKSRHGDSVTDLVLYKEAIDPRNLLDDPLKQLGQIDLAPAAEGAQPALVVYYDFKAHSSDCPLLLCAPRNFKIEALEKKQQQQQQVKREHKPALSSGLSSLGEENSAPGGFGLGERSMRNTKAPGKAKKGFLATGK